MHTHKHIATHTDVYLSLRRTVYNNYDAIPIAEIGETNSISNTGLQCITDRMPCCAAVRAGEWYFPNGATVPPVGVAITFYRNRGDDGTVNLNRLNTNVMMPTGLFCCEVPDATGAMRRVCANISELEMNLLSIDLLSFYDAQMPVSVYRSLVVWPLQL